MCSKTLEHFFLSQRCLFDPRPNACAAAVTGGFLAAQLRSPTAMHAFELRSKTDLMTLAARGRCLGRKEDFSDWAVAVWLGGLVETGQYRLAVVHDVW